MKSILFIFFSSFKIRLVKSWNVVKFNCLLCHKLPSFRSFSVISETNGHMNHFTVNNLRTTFTVQLTKSVLKCTLVTIATLLGTGILGLPSTLAYSGLTPFIITFLINYISQIFIIIALTEVIYLFEIGSQVSNLGWMLRTVPKKHHSSTCLDVEEGIT